MEEDTIEKLDEFLQKKGFTDEALTLRQKRKALKKILFTNRVNIDFEELKYTKNPNGESPKEYISKIQNLEIEKTQIIGYMFMISRLKKDNRKLKRKETFQKVITTFKR